MGRPACTLDLHRWCAPSKRRRASHLNGRHENRCRYRTHTIDPSSQELEPPRLRGGSGAPAGPWTGIQNYIRIDPHEFPVAPACTSSPSPANCRDMRIDSFVLSPFFEASPGFQFQWNLADPDSSSSLIRIYLDPDRDPHNGNWTLIATAAGLGRARKSPLARRYRAVGSLQRVR